MHTGTLVSLRAEAAAKVSVLPKVLAAFEEWVGKVGQEAAAGTDSSGYLELCDAVMRMLTYADVC